MKKLILLLPIVLLLFAGCSPTGEAISIHVSDNGISADTSEVFIDNYYPGARVEISYRVYNDTDTVIQPEIYFVDYADVADYSQSDGAVKAPPEISEWLKFPSSKDIKPGESKDCTVIITMPKDVSNIPDKFGFQVQVAGNNGGLLQTAVGTWWLVNMR